MNLIKRTLAMLLVLVFASSACVSALAASYDAGTREEMQTAFADTSGEDVSINVIASIDLMGQTLTAQEGITYTIGTENGSTLNQAAFNGAGMVHVQTDITAPKADALTASENVTVVVDGNVAGDQGVCAQDDSTVTVNGDVSGSFAALRGFGTSEITVNGNIADSNWGGASCEQSQLTVNGNVDGIWGGFYAEGDSKITLNGDITTQEGVGIVACDQSQTTVVGDVFAGYLGIDAGENSQVTVIGSVYGLDYVDFGGEGKEGGGGIEAQIQSVVTVTGDVIAGDGCGEGVEGADAVTFVSTAVVSVGGNVIGGSVDGNEDEGGNGVRVLFIRGNDPAGSLTIGGAVQGGGNASDLYLNGWSTSYWENPDAVAIPSISVGSYETIDSKKIPPESLERIISQIQVTGGEATWDDFWTNVLERIRIAQEGSQLTVDAGNYTRIPAYVLEAAAERSVTLIIRWNGGDTITVDKAVELSGNSMLLSELLK